MDLLRFALKPYIFIPVWPECMPQLPRKKIAYNFRVIRILTADQICQKYLPG